MFDAFKAGWEAREKRWLQTDQDLARIFQSWFENACETGQRGAFDIVHEGQSLDNKTIARRYDILRQFHTGLIARDTAVTQLQETGVVLQEALHLTQKE